MSLTSMQSYSQYGEDLILWDYFKGKPDGLFVEIGANHPTALNNTWFFEQRGWRGILIEPLPDRCRELRQLRHRSQIIEAALGAPENRGTAAFKVAAEQALSGLVLKPDIKCLGEITVTLTTLDDVLAAAGNHTHAGNGARRRGRQGGGGHGARGHRWPLEATSRGQQQMLLTAASLPGGRAYARAANVMRPSLTL